VRLFVHGWMAHGSSGAGQRPFSLARIDAMRLPEAISTSRAFSRGWLVGMQKRMAASSSPVPGPPPPSSSRARPSGRNITVFAPIPALRPCTTGGSSRNTRNSVSPALSKSPSSLASTKVIQPSTLAVAQVASSPLLVFVLMHTPARPLRRMASDRASCRLPIISLAALVRRLPLIIDWKLGTAIVTTMAATARATISSIIVKPGTALRMRSPSREFPAATLGRMGRPGKGLADERRYTGDGRDWNVRRVTSRLPPLPRVRGSGDDLVAGFVLAGNLHPPLLDEGPQQRVQGLHEVLVAMDLVGAELLDPAHAL